MTGGESIVARSLMALIVAPRGRPHRPPSATPAPAVSGANTPVVPVQEALDADSRHLAAMGVAQGVDGGEVEEFDPSIYLAAPSGDSSDAEGDGFDTGEVGAEQGGAAAVSAAFDPAQYLAGDTSPSSTSSNVAARPQYTATPAAGKAADDGGKGDGEAQQAASPFDVPAQPGATSPTDFDRWKVGQRRVDPETARRMMRELSGLMPD